MSVNKNKPCQKVQSQACRQVGNHTYLRWAGLSWEPGPPVSFGACYPDVSLQKASHCLTPWALAVAYSA